MRRQKFYERLRSYLIIFILVFLHPALSFSQSKTGDINQNTNDDSVSVSIGVIINSDGTERLAKNYDKLKKGDSFQLIIHAHSGLYIYVLSEEPDKFQILHKDVVAKDSSLILPNNISSYIVDGLNDEEKMILLFSAGKLETIERYSKGQKDKTELLKYLEKMKKNYRPNIKENIQARINIGGNVRSLLDDGKGFKTYSSPYLVIKEYRFNVKK